MKKICIIVLNLIVALGIVGCSKVVDENIENKEGKKIVYTTIFPIYDFTKNIAQDKIDLRYIIPPGVEPHDYEITPKNIKDIQNADLLIKNGLGIDSFVDKIENESNLKIVEASENINPISYDNEENEKDEHNHSQYDPHVWLDIDLAIKECENIKDALIDIDEENKVFYEKNYTEYVAKLKELKIKYDENLKNISDKRLIVAHDAYGYICDKYKIKTMSVTGISPNQEPSLSKISKLADYAKQNNIHYVLFDGLVNPKIAQTIANEAKIKTQVLYSIDGISKDDFDNKEDYISLMNKNLEVLKISLR